MRASRPLDEAARRELRRTRAPHVGKNAGSGTYGDWSGRLGGDWLVIEGFPPFPIAPATTGGFKGEERTRRLRDFEYGRDARRSAFEPEARLKDMDTDGLTAEVVFPTSAARMFYIRDVELQRACVSTYNDWIAEFCGVAPKRLWGMAAIPLVNVDHGVQELHRGLKRGLRGAAIWCGPPPELSFCHVPLRENYWAAAEEARTPVALHALPPLETAALHPRAKARFVENSTVGLIEDFHLANVLFSHHIQRAVAQLILSGVPERYPRLNFLLSEWGTGWIPDFVDEQYETTRQPFDRMDLL